MSRAAQTVFFETNAVDKEHIAKSMLVTLDCSGLGQQSRNALVRTSGIGVDINPLAEFVTRVKSIVFSEAELNTLDRWAARLPGEVDIHRTSAEFTDYAELGYYKHLDHPSRWRLRKGIEQALVSAMRSARLGWKRSAVAQFCGPRNGRSTARASSRPSMNSAQRFLRLRQRWSKARASCVRP